MIADVSVLTGIAPSELLAMDEGLFDALIDAVDKRWTRENELLATLVEVEHAHLLAYLRVHSKSGARLPEPFRVERPGADVVEEETRELAPVVSIAELATIGGHGVSVRGVQR